MHSGIFKRRAAAVFAAAVALSLVGCGTTVPLAQQNAGNPSSAAVGDGGLAGSGVAGTAGGASVGAVAADGSGGSTGAAGVGPRRTGTGSAAGAPGTAHSGSSGAAPVAGAAGSVATSGPGWDAKHVYIGVPTENDAAQAAAALGLEGVDFGDPEGDVKAVIADINAHGGLFGRQVVPVFHDNKTSDLLADPSNAGQQNCTYFSQDKRVAAVVNALVLLDVDSFRGCLAQAKIPFFVASGVVDDRAIASLGGYLYNAYPSWNAYAPALLQRLVAQGFFSKWDSTNGGPGSDPVKVGVLVYTGTPTGARVSHLLIDALKRAGHAAVETFEYTDPTGSQMPNAVLRFRSDGITHVFDVTAAVRQFMITAEQQHYRPRYSLVSSMGPRDVIAASAPPAQLRGAMGAGFCPTCEVASAQDPHANPGGPACRAVLAKAGLQYEGDPRRSALGIGYFLCDGIGSFVAGFRAGGGLLAGNLAAGFDRVGTSFATAVTFRSGLRHDRPYIAAAVRDFAWNSSCSCFGYGPTVTPLP